MNLKKIFIGILCFLFGSCKNTTPVFQPDISIAPCNLKFGVTSIEEVRASFYLQKCSSEDDVEEEAIICYYVAKELYFSKINHIHIAFTFKENILIRVFFSSEWNPKYEISNNEIIYYLIHKYGLKTTNLKQLVEKGHSDHPTFTENFRLTLPVFYYTAELKEEQYVKFNLKKVEME